MTTVSIVFDAQQGGWMQEQKRFNSRGTHEDLPNGDLRIIFKVGENALEAIAGFCMTHADHNRVEKPAKLRSMVKAKLEKALSLYKS